MINSYSTVYALGHREIADIFSSPVTVEEKIDGSQLSFCLEDSGELVCRSKNHQLILDAPEKMFQKAVDSVRQRANLLHPGWVYRSEYLEKPKHNVLAYDRVPVGNLIGFDVCTGVENYLPYEEKKAEFERIGFECVPCLYSGMINSADDLRALLETVSVLGGTKVEGVVVKNYSIFTREKKIAIGKFVSEKFKEVAGGEWRKANPSKTDVLDSLVARYRTPARWQKAVQHLKESGELEGSPRDIGKLMLETKADTRKECEEEVKEILFAHFWPKIEHGLIAGEADWYKQQLLESAFPAQEDKPDEKV